MDYSDAQAGSVNRIVDTGSEKFAQVSAYIKTAGDYTASKKALAILDSLEELNHG